jgi:Sulfatase-modifying factor enzyme 1
VDVNEMMDRKEMLMKRLFIEVSLTVCLTMGATSTAFARLHGIPARCGADAVVAGTVCLDKYEASVWRVPNPTTTNAFLVREIRLGRATAGDLTAGGATQLGTTGDDFAPCTDNGQNCADDIYAVSLPSEIPSAFITWFQAQEACANSGKRLPASAEWQVGANGTPDPGPDNGTTDCNTVAEDGTALLTGARSSCVSARGAFDMVGNLAEWVSDWVPAPTFCPGWASFSNDQMCLAGASTTSNSPGALLRGGQFFSGPAAGPFTVAAFPPFRSTSFVGFRCAR